MKRVSLAVMCLLFAFTAFAQHTSSPNGQLDLDGLPDLVLSDNLVGVLSRRPDALLLGSFLWSDVLGAAGTPTPG